MLSPLKCNLLGIESLSLFQALRNALSFRLLTTIEYRTNMIGSKQKIELFNINLAGIQINMLNLDRESITW